MFAESDIDRTSVGRNGLGHKIPLVVSFFTGYNQHNGYEHPCGRMVDFHGFDTAIIRK
jgi:hypothetical protein